MLRMMILSLLLLLLSYVVSFKYHNHHNHHNHLQHNHQHNHQHNQHQHQYNHQHNHKCKQRNQQMKIYGNNGNDNNQYMTIPEIEEYAKAIGLRIQSYATGPLLRLEAFPINNTIPKIGIRSDNNDNKPIGYLTAFIRPIPSNLLHLETIQVQNRRQNLGFKREGWSMDGPGISFILGSYALVWAYQKGCKRTELLAVKDTEAMHQILIRLYESFGFNKLRDVGDDSKSIGDRLLWGAVGTLMELELEPFLQNWTPRLRELNKFVYQSKP